MMTVGAYLKRSQVNQLLPHLASILKHSGIDAELKIKKHSRKGHILIEHEDPLVFRGVLRIFIDAIMENPLICTTIYRVDRWDCVHLLDPIARTYALQFEPTKLGIAVRHTDLQGTSEGVIAKVAAIAASIGKRS